MPDHNLDGAQDALRKEDEMAAKLPEQLTTATLLAQCRVLCEHIIMQHELGIVDHDQKVVALAHLVDYEINKRI